jgi:hypothetical protein
MVATGLSYEMQEPGGQESESMSTYAGERFVRKKPEQKGIEIQNSDGPGRSIRKI